MFPFKEKKVETELKVGPMSVLQQSVENNSQVLINCRNNRKLLGKVHSFDRHMNLILENVREIWKDTTAKGKKKKVNVICFCHKQTFYFCISATERSNHGQVYLQNVYTRGFHYSCSEKSTCKVVISCKTTCMLQK